MIKIFTYLLTTLSLNSNAMYAIHPSEYHEDTILLDTKNKKKSTPSSKEKFRKKPPLPFYIKLWNKAKKHKNFLLGATITATTIAAIVALGFLFKHNTTSCNQDNRTKIEEEAAQLKQRNKETKEKIQKEKERRAKNKNSTTSTSKRWWEP